MRSVDSVPRMTRHLDELFPRLEDLFSAGEQVQDVVKHPGWVHVVRLLGAEIAEIDRHLDGGREPKTQAEYAMAHGRRGGLRGAEEAAGAILHRYSMRLEQQRQKHESGGESSREV